MGTATDQDIELPVQAPEAEASTVPVSLDKPSASDPFLEAGALPAQTVALTSPDGGDRGEDALLAGIFVLLVLLVVATTRILRLSEALRSARDEEKTALRETAELRRKLNEAQQRHATSERQLESRIASSAATAARERDELRRVNRILQGMVRCDPVTGLTNGPFLVRQMARELRRAMRNRRPLSVLVCDIDDFTHYNETYGHERGDDVLKRIGTLLTAGFRRGGDLVARYSADRFVVVLPDTEPRDVERLAQRVATKIAEEAIPHAGASTGNRVTLSWGIATATSNKLLHPQRLLAAAQASLARRRSALETRHTQDAGPPPATPADPAAEAAARGASHGSATNARSSTVDDASQRGRRRPAPGKSTGDAAQVRDDPSRRNKGAARGA